MPVKWKTWTLLIIAVALALGAAADNAPDVTVLSLESKALAGNLLGDPAVQEVAVYLPPGYHGSDRRYPVVYLLHGIGDTFTVWTEHWNVPAMLDELIVDGSIEPMIVVMPNGRNRLLGSYYLSSPLIGGWEDFIVEEITAAVDSRFRTLASSQGRAVAGHSMGGFGAIRFGMDHSDVFGAVYAMSPCCLDFIEDLSWGNPAWKTALSFTQPADVESALAKGDFYPVALIALAAALSPNPDRPMLVDLPVRRLRNELLPAEPVYTRWHEQFPVQRVAEARESLSRLRLLVLDYGIDDQFTHIPAGTAAFSRELVRYRIPHRLDVYDGDHRAQLPDRLRAVVFPTLSKALAGGAKERGSGHPQ